VLVNTHFHCRDCSRIFRSAHDVAVAVVLCSTESVHSRWLFGQDRQLAPGTLRSGFSVFGPDSVRVRPEEDSAAIPVDTLTVQRTELST
jgi:hypothetical protein